MYQRDDLTKSNSSNTQKSSDRTFADVPNKHLRNAQSKAEFEMSNVKCYKCLQRGHMVKACPKKKATNATRLITAATNSNKEQSSDPWVCTVSKGMTRSSYKVNKRRGPICKVDVEIEGVGTQAFLDYGAQVSLIQRQMLPLIKERKGWTLEQCHSRNLGLDQQPVGAEGNALGVIAVVQLQVKLESTGAELDVPFYTLDSNKPIWSGELANCGVILGTNALSRLGFEISLPDGSTVKPDGIAENPENASTTENPVITENASTADNPVTTKNASATDNSDTTKGASITENSNAPEKLPTTGSLGTDKETQAALLKVVLVHDLHLGPQQTRLACVKVGGPQCQNAIQVGLLSPRSELVSKYCDFVEELWTGEELLKVPVTNWTTEPMVIGRIK